MKLAYLALLVVVGCFVSVLLYHLMRWGGAPVWVAWLVCWGAAFMVGRFMPVPRRWFR